jgi:DNA-binding cell septation regulator SpoVG
MNENSAKKMECYSVLCERIRRIQCDDRMWFYVSISLDLFLKKEIKPSELPSGVTSSYQFAMSPLDRC